ncbi:hypothetical protein DBR17_10535 [Sphingomonas sp. HMWF008]|nr:hypothetical protein DBR17_10535 [Sphingomonas sp. HMWF008]
MTIPSLLAVLATLNFAQTSGVPAQTGGVQKTSEMGAVPAPTPSDNAMRIAKSLASEELVRATTTRIVRDQMPKALANDPNFQKIEQAFPGIGKEFLSVVEPIAVAAAIKHLPIYQANVAALFDRRMSPSEVSATADFYGSPAGRHMMALAASGMNFDGMLKRQLETGGKADVLPSEITSLAMATAMPTVKQLDPSELKALMTFAVSPAGVKLNQMRGEIAALAAAESCRSDPAAEAQIAEAVQTLVKRRVSAEAKK